MHIKYNTPLYSTTQCFSYQLIPNQLPQTPSLNLLHALHSAQPTNTILNIDLTPRLQPRLVQTKIVYRANTQDTPSRKRLTNTIHERTTGRAEKVSHQLTRGDRVRLAISCHIVAAADVGEMGVGDGEVRGEYGCGDLAAVGAVADEGAEEAEAPGGECGLHGAAVAGCCC